MTVFFDIDGHLRKAQFHRRVIRVINPKTNLEEEAQASLVLLNRFGILDVDQEVSIEAESFKVLSKAELESAPQYSTYSLGRIGRGARVY